MIKDTFNWFYYYKNNNIYGKMYGPIKSEDFNTYNEALKDLNENIPYNYTGFILKNMKDVVYKNSEHIDNDILQNCIFF